MPPNAQHCSPKAVAYAFLDFNDGGAQRLTLAACRHFDPDRYRPLILCARGLGPLADDAVAAGLPVHALGRLTHSRDPAAVPAMIRLLRRLAPEVVHVALYSRASPYWRLAARLAGVPVVVAHEWSRPEPPPRSRRLADRLLLPGTRFVAASNAHQRDLIAGGAPADSVEVVYSGIDMDGFSPRDASEARVRLGFPIGRPLVLVPARLHPMKGHVDLLSAVPALLDRVPEAHVVCAGDGPLRNVLTAAAESAGLSDRVRFIGQRGDMPDLMASADVVALASRVEGLPSVILEAFASDRAVVATDVGGVPEVVEDGVSGWLVPPRAPQALAAAMVEALADTVERRARAARGKQVVSELFTAELAATRLQEVYGRWLRAEAASRPGQSGIAPAVP